MIDGFGKESLKPELEPFKYKNKVSIPVLGMVDDTLGVSESGYKAVRLNAFMNAKTAFKRLQFGPSKCFILNVGKNIKSHKNIELYVDGWKLKEVTLVNAGDKEFEVEIFDGEKEIEEKQSERYLGQIISSNGSNTPNIKDKTARGTGMAKKIIEMINYIPGGKHHFKIAVMMRNANIITTMLSCSESWYNLSHEDIFKLEKVDEIFWRSVLHCSNQVTKEMIYLELGIYPISYIIKLKQILYLHNIIFYNKKHETHCCINFSGHN